jgi:hypothetical protein
MASKEMSWLASRFGSRLAVLCVALFCLAGSAWSQIATTRCTFSVSASHARVEAWLTGGNHITIQPGRSIALIPGNWHFQVSAKDYKTRSWTLSISGASLQHRFTLEPATEPPPTPVTCRICGRKLTNQAALDKHILDKHTWVKVLAIEPSDADLKLDDGTPIEANQQVRVSPGRHSIMGESTRANPQKLQELTIVMGQEETIKSITVPDNAPPVVTIDKVDPPGAVVTVNRVEVEPKGKEDSVKVSVEVKAEDYQTWNSEKVMKWKEKPWIIPEVKLTRLRYGTVTLSVNPHEAEATVSLVDGKGQSHAITKPEGERFDIGVYTVKAEAPGYREKNPGQKVTIEDHKPTPVLVELVKKEGRLTLSFQPKPIVPVSVYESGARLAAGNDGSYLLSPGTPHNLVLRADGFEDVERGVTVRSNETQSLTITMKPLPGTLKLSVKPNDAEVEITADGKVVKTDKSGAATREIKLDPREDGSGKVCHYKVTRPGFMKDLLTVDCTGDVTVERGKPVSLPDIIVLKSIRSILEECVSKNNPCVPTDGLTVEQLEKAAELADAPAARNESVKDGWGCRWGQVAIKFREKAARVRAATEANK